MSRFGEDYPLPPENFSFQIRVEVEIRRVLRSIQHLLVEYRDSRRGPTAVLFQTSMGKCEKTSREGRSESCFVGLP